MASSHDWKSTACILCSINCGLQVQIEDGHLKKIKGDKSNPRSRGYTFEKPSRLDHYQHHSDRLTSPLRRRKDGSFEAIGWDTAIEEVASRLAAIRDTHGGEKIFYYGGGGQGNHLGGAYSAATRRTLGMRYASNALAQEKTGDFWVNGHLFGSQICHTAEGIEDADLVVGSRYVRGGGIVNWAWYRRGLSRFANFYARSLLRLPVRDCTGGYRCYRRKVLQTVRPFEIRSSGYSFLEEMVWRTDRCGFRIVEVPIVFEDRTRGDSKIDSSEIYRAAWHVLRAALSSPPPPDVRTRPGSESATGPARSDSSEA